MNELYQILKSMDQQDNCILATVLEGKYAGEKMLFCQEQTIWCTLKDSFFSKNQQEIMNTEDSGVQVIDGTRVFFDKLGNEKKLVICGAGHVSLALIQMAKMVFSDITVLEDRPYFADQARMAGATNVVCEPFADALKEIFGDADTYFVILTRGHRYDKVCLQQICLKPHAYIGMIGSRGRTTLLKNELREEGYDHEVLDSIYTPIGLDIGAQTPAEIAVAILAEMIQIKNNDRRSSGFTKELLREITRTDAEKKKVLSTIITRRGSAPREAGTKMLVFADGKTCGTIGGGCLESEIIRKARLMILDGEPMQCVIEVDLSADQAEEEGMVCGGIVEVFLEIVK